MRKKTTFDSSESFTSFLETGILLDDVRGIIHSLIRNGAKAIFYLIIWLYFIIIFHACGLLTISKVEYDLMLCIIIVTMIGEVGVIFLISTMKTIFVCLKYVFKKRKRKRERLIIKTARQKLEDIVNADFDIVPERNREMLVNKILVEFPFLNKDIYYLIKSGLK